MNERLLQPILALAICSMIASQVFAQTIVLFEGEFDLPFTTSIADVPGWHEPLSVTGLVPSDIPSTNGMNLIVSLWDATRPQQTCGSDHPLSGCATVDWSDFVTRPRVPDGGVFDNHLYLQLADGSGDFFLSETGALADMPDQYSNT